MEMKKTWLSYALWLFFSAGSVVLFAMYLSEISAGVMGTGPNVVLGLACAGIAAALAIWFLGRKMAKTWAGRFLQDARCQKAFELFCVAGILAMAVFYRFYILRLVDVWEESVYYEMAKIKSPGGVPQIVHGASYFYTVLLSFVLSLSGNHMAAGVYLQLLLQILSLMCLYFGVRLLAGRIEAVCAMALMAFLPEYAQRICELTPEASYFFLYSAGLCLAGLYIKREGKGRSAAVFVITGLYIGMMGYLDAFGFSLLLFIGGSYVKGFVDGKGCQEGKGRKNRGRPAFFPFILCLSGMFFMFFLLSVWDAAVTGSPLMSIWETWGNVSATGGRHRFPAGPDRDMLMGAVLCFCGLLGAIGFFFHKRQKQDVWILLLLATTVWDLLSAGAAGYHIFTAFAWAVLSGVGITSMGLDKEGETVKAPVPDLVMVDMDEMEEENKPSVKLIENPLPLPKKHIKREMDYDRIVEWEKMKFDIPVDEADDFDF